ncbi:TIP-1 family-domain-containing protein [Scheffersomyces coipomensis]|uniref:TIP-1 family-domain-containing protein n=1 Tax=Scheffersomyces coipomensis TaxID=1788519 RepID=UPI00315D4E7A
MGVEFVNSNFNTLEDLSLIAEKVSELERSKDLTANEVNSRINGTETSSLSEQPKINLDEEKVNTSIEKILSVVSYAVEADDLNDAIENIDALILEFGPIKAFEELKVKLSAKLAAIRRIELLSSAKHLESELSHDLDVAALANVASRIKDLKIIDTSLTFKVVTLLESKVQSIINAKRDQYETKLSNLLNESKWLAVKQKTDVSIPITEITSDVKNLVDLQCIQNIPIYPETWWALDILLYKFIIRFEYHFNTDKETNKITKPEWALNFIETFLSEDLVRINLIVEDIFKSKKRIATYEIITSLLKPLRGKILNTLSSLNKSIEVHKEDAVNREKTGRLLSHLIFELSSFDQRLRNSYKYNPHIDDFDHAPTKKWTGLTGDVLLRGNDESLAVSNWLNFEQELANKRFNSEILQPADAFKIDYDYQGSSYDGDKEDLSKSKKLLKPTYSAYGLVKLFDNLSSHFQTLSIVKYQLKYVSSIQLNLIQIYFDNLNRLFKDFSTTFNQKSVLNFIPGGLNETQAKTSDADTIANGLKGLEMLTEIYCSAKFISNALDYWGDQLIYIQLWEAYKSISSEAQNDISIFGGSLKQYDDFLEKIISKYEDYFKKEIRSAIKEYANTSQWNYESNSSEVEPTSDLNKLVRSLNTYLDQLKRGISQLDYVLVTDRVISIISRTLLEYIIGTNTFSKAGVDQLKVDVNFIFEDLRVPLNLLHDEAFTNLTNSSYQKVQQSLQVLEKVDSGSVKEYKSNVHELRQQFDHNLSSLTNYDINDLLLRIS